MQDLPNSWMKTNKDGKNLKKLKRDDKFELMLTAIEENSGHMIILATIEWGKEVCLQYDNTKSMHSRISLNSLNTYCEFKHS